MLGEQCINKILICAVPQKKGFGLSGKVSACNAGDLGWIPGFGTSPGEGKVCPLQYSDLKNYVGCIVQWVAKGQMQLSDSQFHF